MHAPGRARGGRAGLPGRRGTRRRRLPGRIRPPIGVAARSDRVADHHAGAGRSPGCASTSATARALIRLTGNSDPHLFDGVDPARLAGDADRVWRTRRDASFSAALSAGRSARHRIAGWAQQVFGEPDEERLWQAVGVAMRFDAADVVAAWRDHRERLKGRAPAPSKRSTSTRALLRRRHRSHRRAAAGCPVGQRLADHQDGVEYMPNLPTEEVFTSPDRRRADGVITLTRPLVMPRAGVMVEGLQRRVRRRAHRRGARRHAARTRSAPNSTRTTGRAVWARWRCVDGEAKRARGRASSSTTRSTTRTPAATWRGARDSRTPSRAARQMTTDDAVRSRHQPLERAHRRRDRRAGRKRRGHQPRLASG